MKPILPSTFKQIVIFLSLNNEPGVSVKIFISLNGMLPVLSPKSKGSWVKHELANAVLNKSSTIIFNFELFQINQIQVKRMLNPERQEGKHGKPNQVRES